MKHKSARRLIVLVLVMLGITCVFLYQAYDLLLISTGLPVGTGPAGPPVSAEPFQRTWSNRQVVLLGVGDSITWGLGASGGGTYFQLLQKNDNTRYADMAGRDLSSVLPSLRTMNVARNYTTSFDHISRQLPSVPEFDPNVFGIVVITSGGNDIIHDYGRTPPRDGAMYGCTMEQAGPWCDNLEGRLRTVVAAVRGKFPGGCVIFMANIYDPTDERGLPRVFGIEKGLGFAPWPKAVKVLELVNRKIERICSEDDNLYMVDIRSPLLGHGIYCKNRFASHYHRDDPTFWYYQNLEDPNPRGYDAIRRVFLLKIAEEVPRYLSR